METPTLKLSRDRKVSPVARYSSSKKMHEPLIANSFGLPAGPKKSCPFATDFCVGCYADTLETAFPAVSRLVNHNFDLLSACGSNVGAMVDLLVPMVRQFVDETEKVNRKRSLNAPLVFRIHWDGDLFSAQYAHAWAEVIRRFPDVQFWLYTRSFGFVSAFEGLENVAVYLSVDAQNHEWAREVAAAHPWVRFAFCGQTWDDTEILAKKVSGRNAPRCPELINKIPLVRGEKENGAIGMGACVECGLCIYGRNNVRFAVQH